MSQPVVPHLPTRGDCRLPQFNPEKPRELRRFFKDLKFHVARSHVVDEEEMKQHALQFINCDTAELWEILPEFADVAVKNLVCVRLDRGEGYHSNVGGCYCDRDETVSL